MEKNNIAVIGFDYGTGVCALCNNSELSSVEDGFIGKAIWTSLHQFAVKLDSVNNEVDASVSKTNALVNEIIDAQQQNGV